VENIYKRYSTDASVEEGLVTIKKFIMKLTNYIKEFISLTGRPNEYQNYRSVISEEEHV